MKLTNAQKFYVIIAIVAACTALVLWEVLKLTEQSEQSSMQLKNIASITQRHMESDMMHDAMRGDVLAAILATKDAEMVNASEVLKDVEEHTANFLENADNNMKTPGLDKTVVAKYGPLKEGIEKYAAGAKSLVEQAVAGKAISKEELTGFLGLFEELEGAMGDMSDTIDTWATTEQATIASQLHSVSELALLISAISLLMTAALPIFVMYFIFRPQGKVLSVFESKIVKAVATFDDKANEMRTLAESLSSRINESSTTASSVSSSAKQTSQNSNMVASAAQEMSSSLKGVTEQVSMARNVVQETVNELERVKDISNRLGASTTSVKEIIGLIDEVANKINLLSLNASIEAARAGDAGRGFAVVAQEVKSLAAQTQSSSQEIIKQINEVSAVSEQVMGVINFFQEAVSNIQTNMNNITHSITEQNTATDQITHEITTNASHAQEILTAADTIVSHTSHALEESQSVQGSAEMVATMAKQVNHDLGGAIHLLREAR